MTSSSSTSLADDDGLLAEVIPVRFRIRVARHPCIHDYLRPLLLGFLYLRPIPPMAPICSRETGVLDVLASEPRCDELRIQRMFVKCMNEDLHHINVVDEYIEFTIRMQENNDSI